MSDAAAIGRAGGCWRRRHETLGPIAVALTVVSLAATTVHNRSLWYADFRFEHNANPGQWAMRMGTVWDTSRGFGTFRSEIWPVPTAFFGPLRALGLSMAWSQNLFHAALLAMLGLGVVVLLREWQAHIGWAHIGAALFAMLAPFTVTFMLPSGLFIGYALLPWILVLVRRGILGRQWYHASLLVLLVAGFGSVDRGGLVFAGIAAAVLILAMVHGEASTTWRGVWRWLWRAAVLGVPALAVVAVGLAMSAEVTAQDLRETELASFVNSASSWPETWRGLGFWQVYLRDFSGWAKPQSLPYSTDPWTYALTFAGPVVASGGLLVAPRRIRIVFGSMLAVALVVMVGTHPVGDPSPYGRLLRSVFDAVPATQVLRNSYKAGAIATLALAVLFGMAVQWGVARAGRWKPHTGTAAVGSASLVLIVAISYPVWTNGFNGEAAGFETMPGYVSDAMAWLDDQPGDARVFFAPGAVRNGFRWGDVNDDVLDAMLDRPRLIDVAIHTSRPVAADILSSIDDTLVDGRYRPGWAAELGERFGIEYIALRNDIDWQVWGQPRPIRYESFRDDPATELVASFGDRGAFTTDPEDDSGAAVAERRLRPIEIYRIAAPPGQVTTRADAPPTIVAGDGDAFALLFETDLLEPDRATTFSGGLDPVAMTELLESGAPLVITDTNRRVAEFITQSPQRSHTLAAGTTTERSVHELFDRPGSETTATYGAVIAIDASTQVATGDATPWHRPALALDDSSETSWLVGGLGDPVGERFRMTLSGEAVVDGIDLVAQRPAIPGDRSIAEVRITTSAGFDTIVVLNDDRASIDWPGETLTWVEVEITGVAGLGLGPVGFATISLRGADTTESLVAPDDVFRSADADARLAAALDDAQIGYAFARLIGTGPVDEERSFRRRFRSPDLDGLDLRGDLALAPSAPDDLLARVEGGDITATASGRYRDLLQFRANAAVDGDESTAWTVDNSRPARIELAFAARTIDRIAIDLRHGSGLFRPASITVRSGPSTLASVDLVPVACARSQCRETIEVALGASGPIDTLTLDFAAVETNRTEAPIRIDEITFDGIANPTRPDDGRCLDLLRLDGEPVAVEIADRAALLSGSATSYRACSTITLDAGWHDVAGSQGVLVDTLVLTSPSLRSASAVEAPAVRVDAHQTGATTWSVGFDGDAATYLTIGQSWHPGWRASLNGASLGSPISIDGLAGWRVPAGDDRWVQVDFTPQRSFELALLVSAAALVLVGAVALAGRREAPTALMVPLDAHPAPTSAALATPASGTRIVVAASTALTASYLIGRWSGVAICAAVLLAGTATARPTELVLGASSGFALVVAALTGLVGHRFDEDTFGPGFALTPDPTVSWGRHAGVLLAATICWSVAATVPPRSDRMESAQQWPLRLRMGAVAGLPAAVVAFAAALLVGGDPSPTLRAATVAYELGRGSDGAALLDPIGTGPLSPAVLALAPFAEALIVPTSAAVIAAMTVVLLRRSAWERTLPVASIAAVVIAAGMAASGPAVAIAGALASATTTLVVTGGRDRHPLAAALGAAAAVLAHLGAAAIIVVVIALQWRQGRRGHAAFTGAVVIVSWLLWALWQARHS